MFTDPWYSLVVIAHVLAAVVGFGALGMTGAYARALRLAADPYASGELTRYFRPGRNLAARAILLVPVFGAVALASSGDVHRLYPWLGIGIWVVATGVASGLVWPAEERLQRLVAAREEDLGGLRSLARRCENGAMVTSLCFVAAVVVMVAQP